MLVVDCDGIEVALVPWPDEDSVRDDLALAGRPRVLVVAPSVVPPDVHDPLEARMLEVLLARCGSVVSRRELGSAAGPTACPAPGRSTPDCAVCATVSHRSGCESTTCVVAG